ncbi:interleukin-31 receptor subunit alpha [Alligator mississippiensis]|nr:interleukin-31 receptor subunit alpha [Alligator mississippiensis]
MFFSLLCLSVVLCRIYTADGNSMREAKIFPPSPEIERGSTLKLFCTLGKHLIPRGNASHIIWKLNHDLIPQEYYTIINESTSGVTIHNFTYESAHVRCFTKMLHLGDEQLQIHINVKSGFSPEKPKNISCIYYYDINITCSWISGRETHLNTTYTLVRKHYDDGIQQWINRDSCQSNNGSCAFFFPDIPYARYCFQVTAKNALSNSTTECVPMEMLEIEKLEAPDIISVEKIAGIKQLLNITWKNPMVAPERRLCCLIQYRKMHSNDSGNVTDCTNRTETIKSYNLMGLQDFTEYAIAIQCKGALAKFWSEWSEERIGRTEEKAPSRKVDLWRVIESSQSSGNRYVHLMWKLLEEFPSSESIHGYKIWYIPENNASPAGPTHNTTDKKFTLLLPGEAYVLSVIAYNSAGESPEATLRIPTIGEITSTHIDSVWTFTLRKKMIVTWEASSVNEYVIEWYKEWDTEPFNRSWQYVSNTTNWTSQEGAFESFICYNISVYPLFENKIGAPYSVQAYFQEKPPTVGPETKADNPGKNEAIIKWNEIDKIHKNGFIRNYTIFYKSEGGKELNKTVNRNVLQYKLSSLEANTQYTAYVNAANSAGGKNGNTVTFKTSKFNKEDLLYIFISLGLCMLFLLLLGIICTLKKQTLKRVCWPDVPNPAESIVVGSEDVFMCNSLLKQGQSEDGTVGSENISVLEPGMPHENQTELLLIKHENYESDHTDTCAKDVPNDHKKELCNKEHEVVKSFSPSLPYIVTEQDFRSQMLSAVKPNRKIYPVEKLEEDFSKPQFSPVQNSSSKDNENEDGECTDIKEAATFNPYLKNSVNTREFIVPENLPDRNKNESRTQSTAPFQKNTAGQSYVTLDMFGLTIAH